MSAVGILASLVVLTGTNIQVDDLEDPLHKGRMLLESRQFDAAATEFDRVASEHPENLDARFLLGLAQFGAGNYDRARTAFELIYRDRPADSLCLEFLGRIDFQRENYLGAAGWFRQAVQIRDREGRTSNHLGVSLMRLGRIEEALEAFRNAIAEDPSFAVAHYNVGVLSVLQGEVRSGIYHLQESAGLDPSDADPLEALGDIHHELGEIGKAVECYSECARREPGNERYLIAAARMWELLGKPFSAENCYRAAIELPEKSPSARMHLADLLSRTGRPEEALGVAKSLVDEKPDAMEVHRFIADVAEDLGMYMTARTHLKELRRLGVSEACHLARLSSICERLGDVDGAIDAFEHLKEASADSDENLCSVAGLMASSKIDAIRDVKRARDMAEDIVSRSAGRNPAALVVLSRAESELGDRDAAASCLMQAAELFSENEPLNQLLLKRAAAAKEVHEEDAEGMSEEDAGEDPAPETP